MVHFRIPILAAARSGALLVISALTLSACDRSGEKEAATIYVSAPTIEIKTIAASSTYTGAIQPEEETALSFRVSGQIKAIHVDVGDPIKPGEVLAEIDDRQQRADLDIAEAGLESARAELEQSKAAAARQQSLVGKGAAPQASLEQAKEALTSAENDVLAAESQLSSARKDLADTRIVAEVAGTVLSRDSEIGAVVSAGQTVLTVARGGSRQAVFDVPETVMMVPDPKAMPVTVTVLDNGHRQISGKIAEISPVVDPDTGTVTVKVDLDQQAAGFLLGAPVSGRFDSHQQKGIVLPWTALTASANGPAVWMLDPETHKVTLRDITLGSFEDQTFQVLAGLEAGEQVVTRGGKLLRPGVTVAQAEENGQ
ncbi:efflux RND transporter periplasmic adaptor subunit [Martelella sp. HB161492]|uniref:efflux RND transporter periplasmic adaptor subunit n=1 Tax=Martelella sp. HB161492 TaxID=2720726 RepID=UPI001591DE9C|nr:efflux RND transporter periplasmic adaptor subunit [Martelella sp. HB161492]